MKTPKLKDFQIRTSEGIMKLIDENPHDLILMIGKTGVGKTYIMADAISKLLEKYPEKFIDFPLFSILYLTKSPVVTQTREVLFERFKLPCSKIWVSNYDQLRANLGGLWIDWIKTGKTLYRKNKKTGVIEAYPEEVPVWKKETMPPFVIADEAQALKNPGTQQTDIMRSYVIQGGQVLASSATPFTRPSEAEFITLGTRPYVPGWGKINEQTWPAWIREIAGISHDPTAFNAEAVKRLMVHIEHRVVRIKGVRFPAKSHNHCKLVPFKNEEDRQQYKEYYDKWIEDLRKVSLDAVDAKPIMVIMNKFKEGSELIRAPYMAEVGFEVANTQDKQIIIGFNHLGSFRKCKARLLELGVNPDDICEIVGGQTTKQRNKNIEKYQKGKATYLIMTIKSGGVGLSIDHNEENKLVAKPRYVIAPLPWSAIELIQYIGRTLRLFTVSDVYQDAVGFKDTVEEYDVVPSLEKKFQCLGPIVKGGETWVGLFARKMNLDKIEDLRNMMKEEVVETDEYGAEEEFDEGIIE